MRDFVTVADVPVQTANIMSLGNDDPVFAAGTITAYRERIGLVPADTQRTAQDAARWIQQNGIAYSALQPV